MMPPTKPRAKRIRWAVGMRVCARFPFYADSLDAQFQLVVDVPAGHCGVILEIGRRSLVVEFDHGIIKTGLKAYFDHERKCDDYRC
jgi:hypothetical protein